MGQYFLFLVLIQKYWILLLIALLRAKEVPKGCGGQRGSLNRAGVLGDVLLVSGLEETNHNNACCLCQLTPMMQI